MKIIITATDVTRLKLQQNHWKRSGLQTKRLYIYRASNSILITLAHWKETLSIFQELSASSLCVVMLLALCILAIQPLQPERLYFDNLFFLMFPLLMRKYWLFRASIRWAYGSWSFKCSHIILFSLQDVYIHQDDPSPESLTKSL